MRRRNILALSSLLLLFLASVYQPPGFRSRVLQSVVQAEDLQPRSMDSRVALVVTTLIVEDHLSRHPLDDEISQRAMKSFLSRFDRQKIYFTQPDIDEFMKDQDKLDDFLKAKDVSFPYKVFARYLTRVNERVKLIDELLDKGFDFTIDEEVTLDSEHGHYPKDAEEVRDRWRRQLKYEMLLMRADKVEDPEKTISQRYHNFARRMGQLKNDDVLERFLTSVAAAYDPHTSYFSPSTLDDFRIRMSLNYQGIGAELDTNDAGQAIIRKVMKGGGADQGGQLKAKDRIVSVGQGEDSDMVKVTDKSMDDIISMIRGKEGTIVRLGVVPEGEEKTKIYQITRTRIELDDSAAKGKVLDQGKKENGEPYRVGVIDLPSFYMDMDAARDSEDYRSTTRDVRAILDDFKKKSVDAVVLDLRRNGGGSLPEAISLTGLFMDGPVVQIKDHRGRVVKHNDTEPGMAWDGPLVVLTSKFSASASEILAGAIQDYRRGLIIGDEQTHGKGTVQSLVELGRQLLRIDLNIGALKITMQQFYRPNGDSTQERGVRADISLPSLTNFLAEGEKELDYAMAFDQVAPAEFKALEFVSDKIIGPLASLSEVRRKESDDFARVDASIERFRLQKDRKTMPLNEKQFEKVRKEFSAAEDEQRKLEEEHAEVEKIDRDYYLQEVLAITVDYLKLLGKKEG